MNKLLVLALCLALVYGQEEPRPEDAEAKPENGTKSPREPMGQIVMSEGYYTADWRLIELDSEMPKIQINLTLTGYPLADWLSSDVNRGIYLSIGFLSDQMDGCWALTCWTPFTDDAVADMDSLLCAELVLGA